VQCWQLGHIIGGGGVDGGVDGGVYLQWWQQWLT
jgi:hypothetical protein